MKKSDIAMLVLIASVSVMVAFVIASNIPILQSSKDGTKARTIEEISSSVKEPDTKVFNEDAINPTVETVIGGSTQN